MKLTIVTAKQSIAVNLNRKTPSLNILVHDVQTCYNI